jgi:hypothetical protein
MSTIANSPFRSEFGFESTGFVVDEEGNISAKSITLVEEEPVIPDTDLPADRTFEEVGGNFRITGDATDNPSFTLFRTRTTTIDLDLDSLTFNIYTDDNFDTFYSVGLSHTDGDAGDDAQGKQDGRLAWAVPLAAPDTLYYANADGTVSGTITIQNAPSAFSEVNITGTTASTSTTTGALTVAGGMGIVGDLNLGGELNIQGVGIPVVSSTTNLDLEAGNAIVVRIDDVLLGEINSEGSTVPVNSTTIENTTIGASTPSTAAFTTATVASTATSSTDVTNKNYVDKTATALAITFGI